LHSIPIDPEKPQDDSWSDISNIEHVIDAVTVNAFKNGSEWTSDPIFRQVSSVNDNSPAVIRNVHVYL